MEGRGITPSKDPLQGALRTHGRPVQKAALTLAMLRQILATCDQGARGRRDRALLLFGFAGPLRRSELVALQVQDVAFIAGGLRLRIVRGKTDQAGQGTEIGLPCGRYVETFPVRAFEPWQAVARRKAGPLFRKISTGGGVGDTALHPDAMRRILAYRVRMAPARRPKAQPACSTCEEDFSVSLGYAGTGDDLAVGDTLLRGHVALLGCRIAKISTSRSIYLIPVRVAADQTG